MSTWTPLGAGLWGWAPFYHLSFESRNLYLALYTSPHAKKFPAGLWHGGMSVMAEEARMGAGDTHQALSELERAELVEHDPVARVLRLVQLPDRFERASNGSALKRWWNLFVQVPDCRVRNAHVTTLRWLLGEMSDDHVRVWEGTFGTVEIPVDILSASVSEVQGSLRFGQGVGHRVGHRVDVQVGDLSLLNDSEHSGHRVGHRVGHPQDQDQDLGSLRSDQGGEIQEGREGRDRRMGLVVPIPPTTSGRSPPAPSSAFKTGREKL